MGPGVYIMKGTDGTIIYIGKAKHLRNRLSSYFSGAKDVKTRALVGKIASIEYITTGNEYEALLLENTLIKRHAPRYNINLKDGKSYPAIKVTNEDFPRVYRTRRIVADGARYYGPFPSAATLDTYLELIERLFPLRKCKRLVKRAAPCMYYHIGRCMAPCAGKCGKEDYAKALAKVEKLLSGDDAELIAELEAEMRAAASELLFEKAAGLRDAIKAIREFGSGNQVVDFDMDDRDYVAFHEQGGKISFVVLQMRGGVMSGRDLFRETLASEPAEAMDQFLMRYYDASRPPPPTVFAMILAEDGLVRRYLSEELGSGASLRLPQGRHDEAVMAMAAQNAREDVAIRLREGGDQLGMADLRRVLSLPGDPERIEGFDIAQLSGKFTVASLVSFKSGAPDKKSYRYFRIKSLGGRIDDFESMREAVARRYSRLLAEGEELPDLIMIDGGIGQVNAAKGILDGLGLGIPLAGLAKRDEEIWLPGAADPIRLPKGSAGLRLLQRVRDETHRFATGLNQRLRARELDEGGLASVPGIGKKRRAELLKRYGSATAVSLLEPAELAAFLACGEERASAMLESIRAVVDRNVAPDHT
jgi:excinuclease ABC subunit C